MIATTLIGRKVKSGAGVIYTIVSAFWTPQGELIVCATNEHAYYTMNISGLEFVP